MCHDYLCGQQCGSAAAGATTEQDTVLQLTRRVKGIRHKLFMDNYLSSPQLFLDDTKISNFYLFIYLT
jgi:hypothetical protein